MWKSPRGRTQTLDSQARFSRTRARLRVECLESRTLLSASVVEGLGATPGWQASPLVSSNGTPTGYTPAQIRHAYGFDQIAFSSGTLSGDGSGQTIAIVIADSHPNVAGDLHVFDQKFGLPDPVLNQVNLTRNGSPPPVNADWGLEADLDVQWAHAIAPMANIRLVQAYSPSLSDMFAAVDYARKQPGVSVVSMSWGGSEFYGETSYDGYLTTPAGHAGVTFVASSGDSGGLVKYPAASPNVVSVGGTSLRLNPDGSRNWEPAWYGSDGGVSWYEGKPAYQGGVNPYGHWRTTPDVAYNASMVYGVAVYDSQVVSGQSGWFELGGTSAGAPQWAGLFAIVNQGRALAGLAPLDGRSQTLPALYGLPSGDFIDITYGLTGLYNHSATVGYDLVTGRGSPYANLMVQGLIGAAGAASSSTFVAQQPAGKQAAKPSTPAATGSQPGAPALTGTEPGGTVAGAIPPTIATLVTAAKPGSPQDVAGAGVPAPRPPAPALAATVESAGAAPAQRTPALPDGYKTAGGEEDTLGRGDAWDALASHGRSPASGAGVTSAWSPVTDAAFIPVRRGDAEDDERFSLIRAGGPTCAIPVDDTTPTGSIPVVAALAMLAGAPVILSDRRGTAPVLPRLAGSR
jgi:hypothetical protein